MSKYDRELLANVYKKWTHTCACSFGALIADCPGPPNARLTASVKGLIDEGKVDEIDEFPFDEPESWQSYLEI